MGEMLDIPSVLTAVQGAAQLDQHACVPLHAEVKDETKADLHQEKDYGDGQDIDQFERKYGREQHGVTSRVGVEAVVGRNATSRPKV